MRRKDLETRVEQLIFKDVGAKLAELLLSLGHEHGIADERGMIVGLKITHQEMANLIGSTRETVSLTLSQFKRKGLIQTEGRKVILADPEGLRAGVGARTPFARVALGLARSAGGRGDPDRPPERCEVREA